ncbi:YicC family protein [Glycocaulis profundi]|nr:YicC family protein [Glycocaulis profundi]
MAVLSGMTGFARAERSGEFGTVSVEARSVNGKGLDARVRLPQGLDRLETEFRNRIKAAFTRGSVAVNLNFERADSAMGLQIDRDLMRRLAEAGRDLVEEGLAAPARVDGLLSVRGVVRSDDGEQSDEIDAAIDAAALDALDAALDGLKDARAEEGAAMGKVLAAQVGEIEALTKKAASHAASQPQAIRDRVKAKFDELLPQGLDPDRLAQEAAALAVRADVREELDRLDAHVEAARALLKAGSPAGRKLDFLAQEFNREANTLCSKAADRALTEIGLALKHAVDQLREQVQNVE